MEKLKRIRIKVKGIVQGVGFRPTVYKYAHAYGITGFVVNTPDGVTIEAEGAGSKLNAFVNEIFQHPPRIARITGSEMEDIPMKHEMEFVILRSESSGVKSTEISPDIAVCKDCTDDIFNKKGRRYLYPFTNCTNCGPRFTIIKDRPYDRRLTSMAGFKMCPECEAEYNDPSNRRFHAQPNACPKCGPQLKLLKGGGDPISETIKYLKQGKIVAVKGLGGFNIACDPMNTDTVSRLRKAKQRGRKSFALMMKDVGTVKVFCHVSDNEQKLLLSDVAPIVLLKKKNNTLDHVSPDNNYIGVMLPYTPLHKILFTHIDMLIMTSANKVDEPIATNDAEIAKLIGSKMVDMVLTNNRDVVNRCDDSVVMMVNDNVQVVRRARGFVPVALEVKGANNDDNISLGANLKNTFSIKIGNKIYMSQHIGDLDDLRNYDYQKGQINEFLKLLDFRPKHTNIDAHPGYENYDDKHSKVFHHHAHALSVMGEHDLLGQDVLAVVCDGTGYGTDGKIWGFEFLKIGKDYKKFERAVHLKYFALPGGEKAINEVDRLAISICKNSGVSSVPTVAKERIEVIIKLIDSNINCPLTSSLGRLFDAVAGLCGIIKDVEYEAQAAIMLQKYAEDFKGESGCSYAVSVDDEIYYSDMISQLVDDINNGISINEIAYKFHEWVVGSIINVIRKTNPQTVVFSGGCFQNALLCTMIKDVMDKHGFKRYFFNNMVPINDAGISFGQALV